jgi:EAL domain-containing protein (putative c-di-GMP-specific phosphodiesterase class I)
MVVDKTTHTREALKKLYDLGIRIAIDDFGTGYSSLSYLAKLPTHTLKIDRSFIFDTPHDFNHTQLTKTIIAMGKGLGLEIVAEGIENEEQKTFLLDEGCDYAQGFLIARPMKADELIEYVKTQNLYQSSAPRPA